jgi:4-diphosphocytidyl-2-C-methyl-D-erythritol kinase
MITFPPCKINLGLQVLQKRNDGYHDLQTIFYPIPLFDALEIKAGNSKNFGLEILNYGIPVPGDESQNLIVKAYHLLQNDYTLSPITICLLKNIPMGAGLGGGSSDGAFALKLLNDFFGLNLNQQKLLEYALQLGSDCPFFILNQPCLGEGRGERLQTIDFSLKDYWVVLVKPNVHVSTAAAFSGLNLNKGEVKIGSVQTEIKKGIESWKAGLHNDFEPSVFAAHPILSDVKNSIYRHGAVYASMSGSGATVYGLFEKAPLLKDDYKEHFYFESQLG